MADDEEQAGEESLEPLDPLTALQVGAMQQHEMYMTWVNAGFTQPQALELLKAFITAMVVKG